MRSSSGFARSSGASGFYQARPPLSGVSVSASTSAQPTSIPMPMSIVRGQSPSVLDSHLHTPYIATSYHNTRSYLTPHSLERSYSQHHQQAATTTAAAPPVIYTNNYIGEGYKSAMKQPTSSFKQSQAYPTQYSPNSQQRSRSLHQTSSSAAPFPPYSLAQPAAVAAPLPIQVIYKANTLMNDALHGYEIPIYDPASLTNQLRTTSTMRATNALGSTITANSFGKPSEIAALNEVQLDRIRVYKAQNVERVFGRDVTFDCNYDPLKLFSTKDLRGFLANGFEDFEKNLKKLEANFTGLESSFFHLLHKAEAPKDVFDRFLIALDKRVEKFFEAFNETVVLNRGNNNSGPNSSGNNSGPAAAAAATGSSSNEFFDVHVLRNDFEFWNFKSVIKQGIIEISNRVNDSFLARDNSTYYDAQVMRTMETIIRVFQFLKSDLNGVLHKSILKYGRILELCTYEFNAGEALKSVNFADFVQLDVASLVSSFNDDFERTYPVLLNKKNIVAEKFHEILRDKSMQNAFDLKQLVRSVFARERRKVYSTIYNVISKSGKSEFALTEEIEFENKRITEKMNKIKDKFLELKADPLYLEVLCGRVNIETIRNSQTFFEDNAQPVLLLESFMVAVQNIIEDIRVALQDIIRYKENEAEHYKSVFQNTLSNAVYDLSIQEKQVQVSSAFHERGDMSEFMLQQFSSLEKALNSDNTRENVDSNIDERLFEQLSKNSGNYHLHNIAADFAREGKEKDLKRTVLLENQMRKTQEYSQQIASFMTKPPVDKERTQYGNNNNFNNNNNNSRARSYSSNTDTKGLADKLLETIKQRREEDLEREMRTREEQEEIRLMKEQQFREEKERLQAEKIRISELTQKKYREKREIEQQELQSRMSQREQENEARRQKEQDRLNQRETDRARDDENRRKAREEEQERSKKQREQDRDSEEARKRQRDEEDRGKKTKEDEDAARRKREAEEEKERKKNDEEARKTQNSELEIRRKREEEDRKRREEDDQRRRKQEDEEKRKKQQKEDEDRRKKEEDDRKRKKDEDEERRLKEEDNHKKKDEEDKRRKKVEEEDKRRKKEDDDRRKKEDDDRRKKEDDDRRKKEDDDRRKKEDDDRRKKEDDDRRKKDDEDRRRKEEDGLRKKREEEDNRRKKDDDERRKKEEDNRKKKEEDDRKQKEIEDEKRRKDEADRSRRQQQQQQQEEEEEEEAERKAAAVEKQRREDEEKAKQSQQQKKTATKSGIDYGNLGGSDGSDDQYKYDFDDEDEFDLDAPQKKKATTSKVAPAKKSKQQSNLYDDFSEDSGNLNDLIVGKAETKGTNNKTTTNAAAENKKAASAAVEEDYDFDFDDDLDYNPSELSKKNPVTTTATTSAAVAAGKSSLPPLTAGGGKTNAVSANNNKTNDRFSYDNDDDFEIDADDQPPQISTKPAAASKVSPTSAAAVEEDYDFDYDEEIEEDIEEAQLTDKNQKSKQATPPPPPAKAAGGAKAASSNNTNQEQQPAKKVTSNFDYGFDLEDDEADQDEDGFSSEKKKPTTTKTTNAATKAAVVPAADKKINDDNDDDEEFDYDYDMPEDIPDNNDSDPDAEPVVPRNVTADSKSAASQQQQQSQQQPRGGQQNNNNMTKEEMDEMLRQQEEDQQAQFEITYQLIAKTNEYVKKTRFGRSNHVNLSRFNSFDAVIRLYEEYIQNLQVYLFNVSDGDRLIELFDSYANQSDDYEKLAEAFATGLQENYYESTKFTDFSPETKLYFALQPNQFGFQLVEVNMGTQVVSYFYMVEEEEEENLMNQLQDFHGFFVGMLGFEGFEASPVKIEDSTLKVLQIYEKEPFLQYMIMLFPLVYELFSEASTIIIDHQTIDRIFYIQLSLENFYADLESHQDAVSAKFAGLLETYQQHKEFAFSSTAYEEFSTESLQMLLEDLNGLKSDVLENPDKKYGLAYFEISVQQGDNPVSYYFYVSKSANPAAEPHEIGIFCLTLFDQVNNQIIDAIGQLADEEPACEYRPHIEPSRHNGLYEYNEFTLASWAQLIEKKKLSPFVAINIINFSMIPYYVIYKGND